jgi:hypothetical protein
MEEWMTTGARGEGYIKVEGEEKPVLFTNRALAEAEKVLGKSMLVLLSAMQSNALGVNDVVVLLAIGLEHGRREAREARRSYTVVDAFDIMDQIGFTAVTSIVVPAVGAVLAYSETEETDEDNPPV